MQHDQFARNTRAQLKQVFDAIRVDDAARAAEEAAYRGYAQRGEAEEGRLKAIIIWRLKKSHPLPGYRRWVAFLFIEEE